MYVSISAILPFCNSFCRSAIPAKGIKNQHQQHFPKQRKITNKVRWENTKNKPKTLIYTIKDLSVVVIGVVVGVGMYHK
jgi:hypothetical protein